MRVLLWAVLALGFLWGGYWFVGSAALEKHAEQWFVAQNAAGHVAEKSSLSVQGFPSRFDLTVNDLHLADPVSGFGWRAPFVQVFSMTWKPWHLIAALPHQQSFITPDQDIGLTSSNLRGSLELVPLALNQFRIEGADLAATSSKGWQLKAKSMLLATRQSPEAEHGHEVNLALQAVIPDPALMTALSGQSDLPGVIETAGFDLVAGFSAPLDRHAGAARPDVTSLQLNSADLRWGDLVLQVTGSAKPDANGFAEGRFDIRLENWRKALAPAIALGLIKPEIRPTIERALELYAQQGADPTVLELPLVLSAGRMSLGPLPLGPAPQMRRATQ